MKDYKEINFDMDGTIADLYAVDGWLEDLRAYNPRPYEQAKVKVNMSRLARLIHKAQRNGYKVNIISWLSKCSTTEYDKAVINAKKVWLAKHLPSVQFDKVVIVAYGTPKSTCGCGVLFDDEEQNRKEWGKGAYTEKEIFEVLAKI